MRIILPKNYKFVYFWDYTDEFDNINPTLKLNLLYKSSHGNKFDGTYDSIGTVNAVPADRIRGKYETHSFLFPKFRKKGLGTLMYAKAISLLLSKGYKIQSSEFPSGAAQRVWKSKSLKKYFDITTVKVNRKYYNGFDTIYVPSQKKRSNAKK